VDSLTSNAATTDADVALIAKGAGATLAQIPDSTTTGGDKRGTRATDFQKVRTASTQVASGSNAAIGGGGNNTGSGPYAAIAGGYNNLASGQYAVIAGGQNNTASNTNAAILGGDTHVAAGYGSVVIGSRYGTTRSISGNLVFTPSAPIASAAGVSQAGVLILGVQTTNATTTTLCSDSNAAGTFNQVILPDNSAYYFRGSVIANVTGGGNTKAWSFEGAIKRGASAAATTLVQSVINPVAEDSGASAWTIALAADTTNGGLQVTVTGAASTTIRWVCKVETTEVTF
jgi:hypothetical protein